jgi:hypothetical protein
MSANISNGRYIGNTVEFVASGVAFLCAASGMIAVNKRLALVLLQAIEGA